MAHSTQSDVILMGSMLWNDENVVLLSFPVIPSHTSPVTYLSSEGLLPTLFISLKEQSVLKESKAP